MSGHRVKTNINIASNHNILFCLTCKATWSILIFFLKLCRFNLSFLVELPKFTVLLGVVLAITLAMLVKMVLKTQL